MNIEQDNILLAEFLGYSQKVVRYQQQIWNSSNEYYWAWTEGELWVDHNNEPIDDEFNQLKFHYDWNQLMLVFDKIRSYPTYSDMEEGSVSIERFEINKHSMFLNFAKRVDGKTILESSYHVFIEGDLDASDSDSFIDVIYKCCVDFAKFIK